MNYLKSSIQSMVGNRNEDNPSLGTEIVERLVDRLTGSTVFEDRRDALRALRSLSKRYRMDVGSQAIPVLLEILKSDAASVEIVYPALETLNLVVSGDVDEDSDLSEAENQDLGERFSDLILKDKGNVAVFLNLVENSDFNIRLPAVRLITGLLRFRCKYLQDILLSTPGSIPTLTDLLHEQREVIRNDVVLLLLELIRGNSNIQKTVAFQNVFDCLLDMVLQEGDSIVAEDCLYVVLSLLKNNASNQHLFRENSLIQKLVPILTVLMKGCVPGEAESDREVTWTPQRVSNTHLLCQVVRSLVSPSNQLTVTSACQKVANHCGLLRDFCNVILTGGVPADVLTEAVNTVAEILRGSQPNQDFFGSLQAESDPPQPALVVLLLSMVSEQQPFHLRCAILYCVQCYLYKNTGGKESFIGTLLPSKANHKTVSTGHVLCTGLVSADPLNVWFSCCIFLHCLIDCEKADRERLLNVQMAFSLGNPPVSLIQQTTQKLLQSQEFLSKVGVLMFLIAWLDQCPKAVGQLLRQTDLLPYLTAQAGASEGDDMESLVQNLCGLLFAVCIHFNDDSVENFSKESLKQVLEKRIGVDVLLEKLDSLSKNEHFARAAQRPYLKAKTPQDIVFDHEFTKLYRKLEQHLVDPLRLSANKSAEKPSSSNFAGSSLLVPDEFAAEYRVDADPHAAEHHQMIVNQYRDMIKRQDDELAALRSKMDRLILDKETAKASETNLDEMEMLKKQLEEKCQIIDDGRREFDILNAVSESTKAQLDQLKVDLDQLNVQLQQKTTDAEYYRYQSLEFQKQLMVEYTSRDPSCLIAHLEYQVRDLEAQLGYGYQAYEQQSAQLSLKNEELRGLKSLCEQKDADLAALRSESAAIRQNLDQLLAENQRLKAAESNLLEQQKIMAGDAQTIDELRAENLRMRAEISQLLCDKQTVEQEQQKAVQQFSTQLNELTRDKNELASNLESVRKEHEDLLLLLADQDVKLREYKRRLRSLNDHNLSADEDEEEQHLPNNEAALKGEQPKDSLALGMNGYL